MTIAIDTTGKTVVAFSQSGTRVALYRDCGWYEGTKPELNVRKLEMIEELEGLTVSSPAYQAIGGDAKPYGCGWGDTSGLYVVGDEEVAALRAAVRPGAEPTPADAESKEPMPREIAQLFDRYGSSDGAWEAADEEACFKMRRWE